MDRPDLLFTVSSRTPEQVRLTGDIVLTSGAGPGALANRAIQSLVEGVWARATHAMLVAAADLYLDAGPRQGVALVPADRYAFTPRARPGLRRRRLVAVFRHPLLAGSSELRRELLCAMRAFCGRGYNYRFLIGGSGRSDRPAGAFCSQLVVEVFQRLGWSLVPDRPAHAVLPQTLLRVLPMRGWREVTPLYARAVGADHG